MGFFATFSAWLDAILATYIGTNTARMAAILEPAILVLAALYVMIWGYLLLTGKLEEPFVSGVKRFITLAVILAVSLHLWLYNSVIVDTFFRAPAQLAADLIGAYDPVNIIDQILFTGGDAATLLLQKGGFLHGSFSFVIAGYAVYLVVGFTALYAMFLLALCEDRALDPLGIGASLHRAPLLRDHEALLRVLDRADGELRLHHDSDHSRRLAPDGDCRDRRPAGGRPRRRDPDCGCRTGVPRGGLHVSRHAPGDADGGGASKRSRAQLLRRGECARRLGLWPGGLERRAVRARALRSRDDAVGSGEPQGGLLSQSRRARQRPGREVPRAGRTTQHDPPLGVEEMKMKIPLLLIAMTLLSACSTGPRRIACDRHLVPINPPAAKAPQPESPPMSRDHALEAYFAEAASWDPDREAMGRRSARIAWWVAGGASLCTLALAAALLVLMPLKRVDPFVIRVDNATGVVDVVPVYAGTERFPQAIRRYFLAHYVTVCERFNFSTAESDYEECGAFQTPAENQRWYATWAKTNPISPLNLYKDGTTIAARVTSVSFFTRRGRHEGYRPGALCPRNRRAGGTAEQKRSYWIATIQYAFTKPSTLQETRRWNPLGFKVLDVQTEREAIGAVAAAGGAP